MLVHLPTMGVLDTMFVFKDGAKEGSYIYCNFKNTQIDNPEEWVEVKSGTPLAKRIKTHYPWIEPVYAEQDNESAPKKLIDVRLIDKYSGKYIEEKKNIKEEMRAEAKSRGYKNRVNVRPRGLMPFLRTNGMDRVKDVDEVEEENEVNIGEVDIEGED